MRAPDRRAARVVFMTGEVFLRFRPRRVEDGLAVPLQIQMLPSEMLALGKQCRVIGIISGKNGISATKKPEMRESS